MENAITPVNQWQRVTPENAIAQIKNDARFAVKSCRLHGGEVSPVTLYCYLKTRFGTPNGEMMAFRTPGSDNVVQWHYKLSSGAFIVDVWGANAGLQFIAHGTTAITPDEWSRVFEELKAEFGAIGSQMGPTRKQLEKWAQYLRTKGLDPEDQHCTDEFAPHVAHNAKQLVACVRQKPFRGIAGGVFRAPRIKK